MPHADVEAAWLVFCGSELHWENKHALLYGEKLMSQQVTFNEGLSYNDTVLP